MTSTEQDHDRLIAEALLIIGGQTILLPTRAHLLALRDWYEAKLWAADRRGTMMDGGLFP